MREMKTVSRSFASYRGAQVHARGDSRSAPAGRHASRRSFTSVAIACLAYVSCAEAVSFDGTTSGIFIGPMGPSTMFKSGVDTRSFSWGTGVGTPPSLLKSFTTSFADSTDQPFALGSLNYFNCTVRAGTEAYVDYAPKMGFGSVSGRLPSDYKRTPWERAGAVRDLSATLRRRAKPCGDWPAQALCHRPHSAAIISRVYSGICSDQFFVLEDRCGINTANNPLSVPDTGSTLALVAIAFLGLGGLKHKLADRSVPRS